MTMSDEDGPWGVKWIAGSDRAMALAAAKRARLTMGEWLGAAIRAYVESERGESSVFEVFPPSRAGPVGEQGARETAVTPFGSTLSIAEIGEAVRIATEIAQLRQRGLPRAFLTQAQRLLNGHLRGAMPIARSAPQRLTQQQAAD
jgi:hypothetical protein